VRRRAFLELLTVNVSGQSRLAQRAAGCNGQALSYVYREHEPRRRAMPQDLDGAGLAVGPTTVSLMDSVNCEENPGGFVQAVLGIRQGMQTPQAWDGAAESADAFGPAAIVIPSAMATAM
jgi:hypothetical protein